jgi:hypothetical protein
MSLNGTSFSAIELLKYQGCSLCTCEESRRDTVQGHGGSGDYTTHSKTNIDKCSQTQLSIIVLLRAVST